MIAYIEGEVIQKQAEALVVKANGVGYEVFCSQFILDEIFVGEKQSLWVYTQVREDMLNLYGFKSQSEKEFFLSLLKVNGVGPKMALKVLSALPFIKVLELIDSGDVKGLTKLPKVGKKTAEQMVLTLKGKLVLDEETAEKSSFPNRKDIVSALVHLGFRVTDAEEAVDKMDSQISTEAGIRKGLALLSGV